MKKSETPLLKVTDLTVSFSRYDRGWNKCDLQVIRSLDAEVYPGEILAVVGASGSGKSLLAHSVLGILPENASVSGKMEYMGKPLTPERQKQLRGKEIEMCIRDSSWICNRSLHFLCPIHSVCLRPEKTYA